MGYARRHAAWLLLGAWLAPQSAFAQGLPGELSRCAGISGLLQRLACYDAAVKNAGIAAAPLPIKPPTPASGGYAKPSVVEAAPSFGSESLPRRPRPAGASSLNATVADIQFDATGRFTIKLQNGQIWRQLPGDTSFLAPSRPSQVHISRALFGGYDLKLPGINATYRVLRVQ